MQEICIGIFGFYLGRWLQLVGSLLDTQTLGHERCYSGQTVWFRLFHAAIRMQRGNVLSEPAQLRAAPAPPPAQLVVE